MRAGLALLLLALPAFASADPRVDQGNEAFWQNRFKDAAEAYREVTEAHPQSADAWYNLGTAYAREGALGPATHALEQARLLDPSDDDTRHNLAQVRSQALESALALDAQRVVLPGDDDTGAALLEAVSPRTAAIGFALTWIGFFLALAVWRRAHHPARRTAAGFAGLVLGLLALGCGSLVGAQAWFERTANEGVVLQTVRVREGPGPQYPQTARISAGVKVTLRGTDRDWQRVQLPDGSEGWLAQREVAALLRPTD